MPLWTSQGKARKNPDFLPFSSIFHSSAIVRSRRTGNQRARKRGIGPRFDPGRVVMMIVMRDWWQEFRSRRRHRQDIRAFHRLMDARDARRAIQ
jgi:hypothetical protein